MGIQEHAVLSGVMPHTSSGRTAMGIPDRIRTQLELRAGHRCEYCHRPLWGVRAEVEHITPRACGGTDETGNLALSCVRCNANKGKHTQAVDPVYGSVCALFHPRRQRWDDHFVSGFRGPVGRTDTGRATASLLFAAQRASYPEDLGWHWAVPLRERAPELHASINRLRVWRLGNRFADMEDMFRQLHIPETLDPYLTHRATLALALLRLEMLFTRSRPGDLPEAARLARRVIRTLVTNQEEYAEFQEIASIIYQQIATTNKLAGNHSRAERMQRRAVRSFEASLAAGRSQDLLVQLRLRSMKTHAEPVDAGRLGLGEIEHVESIAAQGEIRPLAYVAELVLASPIFDRHLDRVLESATRVLEVSGYGQDADYANAVVLRRRWWGLRLAAGEHLDVQLLVQDLELWRKINMHNELRQIRSLLGHVCATRARSMDPDLRAALQPRGRTDRGRSPRPHG